MIQCLLALTHQITHNNMFYNTKLLVRLHIINVQPICKIQLTHLGFKNIRCYRLTNHSWYNSWSDPSERGFNPMLKFIFISTHERCSKHLLMSNTFLDIPHTNSRQSSFISTSNIWTTVARSNNSIILNKLNYSGSQNMQSETQE